MKAIQFDLHLPKYAFTKAAGKLNPSLYVKGPFNCLELRDIEKPQLPTEEWVEVNVTYGGICGSDLNLITLKDSPATSPYVSFPFTIGHEIVGKISYVGTEAAGIEVGERVVIDPVLACEARGITPFCKECEKGNYNLCQHMNAGILSPGLLTGTCKDTGGSWSSHLVAHQSQVIKLPEHVSDENGVLIEPFSCALHTVMQNPPEPDDTVLVIGAGVIGISVVAALRALEYTCNIVALVKYDFQAELARHFGADDIIFLSKDKDYISTAANTFQADVLKPVIGEPIVHGGADVIYECVGNKKSLDDALRFAKRGGKVSLLGLANFVDNMDLTMVWLNELDIKGSFAYGTDTYKGEKKRTLQIAVELIAAGKVDLAPLLTHTFALENYHEALDAAANKSNKNTMKVVFAP
ncbi:zinc-dependent alcohol dehydrogenase [Salsuginibacillus kocurii]|uniref:zinc-dependent alcohol dehydrogenase n=1 Tax=Salsuginibacillus kocurii TaxID=427078 RepID=UPI000368B0A7|nr:zinc-binding dehydrogenase [Salsuginibacillus kocurii]